jgi:hypothetical protein
MKRQRTLIASGIALSLASAGLGTGAAGGYLYQESKDSKDHYRYDGR